MNKEEIDKIVSVNLNIDLPLRSDISMLNTLEWDSLVYMSILAQLEEKSNRKVSTLEAYKLQSLKGIYEVFMI